MPTRRSLGNGKPKTSAEVGHMIGTGIGLDDVARRAVREAIELNEFLDLQARRRRSRGSSRKARSARPKR